MIGIFAALMIAAETVFVFPNNGNVILAAQQAAQMVEKQAIVIPTKNVAMGIAAAVAFQPDFSAEDNTARMLEAAEKVRTATITYAVRDSEFEALHIISFQNTEFTIPCNS